MTKEQFEAHVRAAAERKHPFLNIESDALKSRGIAAISDAIPLVQRESYIAARMEHEWPLVEALQEVLQFNQTAGVLNPSMTMYATEGTTSKALSPYTTKPIEP